MRICGALWRKFRFLLAGAVLSGVAAAQPPVRIPSARIVVRAQGPEFKTYTVQKGRFFLVIRNLSGTPELTFHLSASDQSAAADLPMRAWNSESATMVNVEPGTYVLTEEHQSTWQCQIVVQ